MRQVIVGVVQQGRARRPHGVHQDMDPGYCAPPRRQSGGQLALFEQGRCGLLLVLLRKIRQVQSSTPVRLAMSKIRVGGVPSTRCAVWRMA